MAGVFDRPTMAARRWEPQEQGKKAGNAFCDVPRSSEGFSLNARSDQQARKQAGKPRNGSSIWKKTFQGPCFPGSWRREHSFVVAVDKLDQGRRRAVFRRIPRPRPNGGSGTACEGREGRDQDRHGVRKSLATLVLTPNCDDEGEPLDLGKLKPILAEVSGGNPPGPTPPCR